jgi:hypothetical protein
MISTENGAARSPANLACSLVMTGIREHQMLAGLFSPDFNDLAAIVREPHGTTKAATLPRSVRAFLALPNGMRIQRGCRADMARFRQPPAGGRVARYQRTSNKISKTPQPSRCSWRRKTWSFCDSDGRAPHMNAAGQSTRGQCRLFIDPNRKPTDRNRPVSTRGALCSQPMSRFAPALAGRLELGRKRPGCRGRRRLACKPRGWRRIADTR